MNYEHSGKCSAGMTIADLFDELKFEFCMMKFRGNEIDVQVGMKHPKISL